MSRRVLTLLIAGLGVIIALAAATIPAVPYVALTPGPTLNTLGSQGRHQLISITGRRTYRTSGHLNMVTVSFIGGPGSNFNIFAALRAWLTPGEAVVPQQEIFTPGQSQQQVLKQDTEEMTSSQQTATAAALCQLGIKYTTVDTVVATVKGTPAYRVLHRGDVITAVDGTPVNCRHEVTTLIRARKPGTPVRLTIRRAGRTAAIGLRTADISGHAVVGVDLAESYVFPFPVKISIGSIGGPSAGLMFALGIIDKLTPDNLTGGRFIAGTGEITANGQVQPIGGIQQKMAGARAAGATVFLTPAQNCPDTVGAVPAGLKLVKVSTLSGAIADLQALKRGRSVPSC
ncbi:MAG: PDZ domain-containing protein [Streptosporangiaceae bacterium]